MISQMTPDGSCAREMHEVHGRLGVAGAPEHAAGLGAQRKNVARLHQVIRHGGRRGHDANGFRAVGGADAAADAVGGIHADLEIRAKTLAVLLNHAVNAKLLQALAGRGHANQSTPVLGHEIDGGGGDELRGHDEITFIFAVGVVHDDDHPAFAKVGDDGFDGIKRLFHSAGPA